MAIPTSFSDPAPIDFWVFNCTPGSGLKAFPHYPFEKAVEYARAECGKAVDTAGWYDSANKPKPAAKGQKKPLEGRQLRLTAFDSLEHLLPDEVDAVLDEIARILKPGGIVIASICYHSSKTKVNGEGPHPTVQAEEWWIAKFARFGKVLREGRYVCAGP